MPYHFELADPSDDAALRALLREIELPGAVRLSMQREPIFFAADAVLGDTVQTLVEREQPAGPPVAVVSRSARTVYIGGRPERIGYLSGLRALPAHQGRAIVGRGWHALRNLHRDNPLPFYLLSVTADNARTLRLISLARGDAPAFTHLADIVTLALLVNRRHCRAPHKREEAIAVRSETGLRRDLFPSSPIDLPGWRLADEIAVDHPSNAVTTLWDPLPVRQTVVAGYTGLLGRTRPLLNVAARVAGFASLPSPGEQLRSAFTVRTEATDAASYRELLRSGLREAGRRSFAFLLVGHDTRDPYLAVAKRWPHVAYRSSLFAAHWPDGAPPKLSCPVHAEIATY